MSLEYRIIVTDIVRIELSHGSGKRKSFTMNMSIEELQRFSQLTGYTYANAKRIEDGLIPRPPRR